MTVAPGQGHHQNTRACHLVCQVVVPSRVYLRAVAFRARSSLLYTVVYQDEVYHGVPGWGGSWCTRIRWIKAIIIIYIGGIQIWKKYPPCFPYDRQPRTLSEIILKNVIIFITKCERFSRGGPSDSPAHLFPPQC